MTTYVHPPSLGLFSSVALNLLFKRVMLRTSHCDPIADVWHLTAP